MSNEPVFRDHQAWLGYLQPDGLVVSPAALVDLQVILPRDVRVEQQRFLECVTEQRIGDGDPVPVIADLAAFLHDVLEWPETLLHGFNPVRPLSECLTVPLREFGETLVPSAALADAKPKDAEHSWLLLIQSLPLGTDLDAAVTGDPRGWSASPTRRFERLLRETQIPIGLLANGTQLRLMYAPRGENAGSLTFPVQAMTEITGRPILGACHMLLKRSRLLAGPVGERLPAVLAKSREYQGTVSTQLAGQVLEALYDLLRGFQAADERTSGALLKDVLAHDPDSVYGGLLNVLLRLVFLLYAEDRGLMPGSALYVQHYSVHGLFEKLRTDAQNYPDTLDHRYGAWPRLLALFRAVHGGCRHPQLQMPARHGYLFDPERFSFLEGRVAQSDPQTSSSIPLVSDGTLYHVLDRLLMLKGERLSYRTLDVEQIGSVYEAIMGFRLEVAHGPTIALKPPKKHGAPPAVNLAALLAQKPSNRAKWLNDTADQKLDVKATKALKEAANLDDLLAALERRIHRGATPSPVAQGAMTLQPSDERRRSGSHYTPRTLTEPIVTRTLAPVLAQLGEHPTPEQILNLKICDLAVGSGAFLVAACRALGEALVSAWHHHGQLPPIPPDEDEVLLARRLVAQRCLYGVDKNPMAADLAKLSLWLATLARDHPFTFLDHSIRAGDSLLGLNRRQIIAFNWEPSKDRALDDDLIERRLVAATEARRVIIDSGDDLTTSLKAQKLAVADESLELVRLIGDLSVAAFFSADKDKVRQIKRDSLRAELTERLRANDLLNLPKPSYILRSSEHPFVPFHWEIEFPEVFQSAQGGFDAIVGNPPFAGKNTLIGANTAGYLDWLKRMHPGAHGNADLVAHFFRRAFDLLRPDGCFGLIATNTIGQGDTRSTGLRWICTHGGAIYWARKRYKWPGEAAVVVSVVHIKKSPSPSGRATGVREKASAILDGRAVERISAYLFHAGGDEDPARLEANADKSFQGSIVLGMGFTFDDTDTKGVASSLADMRRLIERNPRNAERIFPYIGGEEVNDSPTHDHHRYVINFADFPLRREDVGASWAGADITQRSRWLRTGIVPLDYPEPVAADWPELLEIIEQRVKPERLKINDKIGKEKWWLFLRTRGELQQAIRGLERVLVICRHQPQWVTTFMASSSVFAESLIVFPFFNQATTCCLQARPHEIWSRFFGSSMKDDLRYNPSDCFETFPFPPNWRTNPALESAGLAYHTFRAALMVQNNEGLTKTYNRFHDPNETAPAILRLRELHAAMDRAVLDSYGWTDLPTDCEFLLDWDDEEDDETSSGRRKKKPWRLRWPDDVRDEVLARLLALNAKRAAEEASAGLSSPAAKSQRGSAKRSSGCLNLELGLREE
ncbi:Eco57I restriction-modification methylase domain-containing protein [Thiocapsa roseopersicina]|uniref:site-specific DNA-methyltransferase (adenine-specific) n=1 Tax=Thiocapsa roseopersicina TaxID=1058 RepID=A0A1H3BVR2_THIRO|nr:DNA methyltransferase [Thiocapsa roseopersicina]SDX45444.1 N-6 DNA Methylase [Thiocapsa roseopersicina]